MIDSKELMIGNWVYDIDGKPYQWSIYDYTLNEDFYSPIPLTHEILEKAGFKFVCVFDNGSVSLYSNKKIQLQLNATSTGNVWFCCWLKPNKNKHQLDVHIKSLHQLQNLYYSLSQQHLNIQL